MAEAVLVRGLGQRADVYFGKPAHSAGSACWRGGGKRRAAGSTNRGRDAQAPGDAGDEHRGQGSEGARLPDDDVDGRRATERARRWPHETPWQRRARSRRWQRERAGSAVAARELPSAAACARQPREGPRQRGARSCRWPREVRDGGSRGSGASPAARTGSTIADGNRALLPQRCIGWFRRPRCA
ncbi:unnamed protein product [Miscanthus lutarioriparius]|uniref:Uncharacterized protein n=1 Tax=Miscanthus lutarioriparius TaxID=422564 RepID=A0A811S8N5_9POAL|nr:unnamed protein product [Miscanthus lutarioriparius]